LPARPSAFQERRRVLSRLRRVAEAAIWAVMVSVIGISAARMLGSDLFLACLWAAPMALMARSLAQVIMATGIVVASFLISAPDGWLRSGPEVIAFLMTGALLLSSTGVLFGRYIQDRRKAQRERDVFQNAYATTNRLIVNSKDPVVWLDGANSWIQANPAAFDAMGMAKIRSMTEIAGRAEHGAMVEMMHSASKDEWLALIEDIDSLRPSEVAISEGRLVSRPAGWAPSGSPKIIGETLTRRMRLADAQGKTKDYLAVATLVDERNVLVHLRQSAGQQG